jgi:hypothetical protein
MVLQATELMESKMNPEFTGDVTESDAGKTGVAASEVQ